MLRRARTRAGGELRRPGGGWRGLFGGLLWALLLVTGRTAESGAQVLHEPVVVPQLRCQDGACRRDGMPGESLPEAVVSSEGLLGAPEAGRSPAQNEKIYSSEKIELPFASGASPPGADPPPVRRDHVLPDSETGPQAPGERLYHEVFNPAVFPYKRMSVVDAVGEDGALTVRDPRKLPLEPGDGRVRRDHDPFYASVVVDFVSGQPVPLPTPAAGVRVVSYRATPTLQVRFLADGADNLYALAARGGRYRLVYLVEAEPRYFAGPLWHGSQRVRLADVPSRLLRPLPRRLQREARAVLRRLGLREGPGTDYAETLDRLVAHFRAFALEELDTEEGGAGGDSLYSQIALQQRGVCRHRAYAFVITALAAGIPARYVENELHVFVEVFVPLPAEGGGYWRRINLGGAPLQQRVVEGESKVAYREKGGDPFSRPPEFRQGAAPTVSGLPRQSTSRRRPENGSGGGGKDGSGGEPGEALPRLDGPEDRARRGEGPSGDPSEGASKDPRRAAGPAASGQKAEPTAGPAAGPATHQSKPASSNTPGGSDPRPATAGDEPGTAAASAPGRGDPAEDPSAPEFPPDDDLAQPEDRRRDPASEALIPTQVTLTASAARRVYRGTAIPVRGQVRAGRGSAAGLQVVLILAIPGAPQPIGRAFTTTDGSYQTEVEIPAGVPLGSFPLVARVKGDQTHRGSSTGRYDR